MEEIPLGTIKKGREIGIKNSSRYIYKACALCGKPRWTAMASYHRMCTTCSIQEAKKRYGSVKRPIKVNGEYATPEEIELYFGGETWNTIREY